MEDLRRVADLLEGKSGAGNPETTPAPLRVKHSLPTAASYGLKRVRCSGCSERPNCQNILERKQVNKCRWCHSAESVTRNRLSRAKRRSPQPNGASRKRAIPQLRTVRCSGCPERPDCANVLKRYRVQKVNQCWQCVAAEGKTRVQKYQKSKRSNSQPKLRSVWHGGEGLRRCSVPSSLSRDSFEEAGV